MSKCDDCGKGNQNKHTTCWNCGSTKLTVKRKMFDRDAVYSKIVKTYIDKYNKTPDEANAIAMKIVDEQQQAWKEKTLFNF